jgi:hypothetical protein
LADSQSGDDPTSDWIDCPEKWDRTLFIANASSNLNKKMVALTLPIVIY